MEGRSTLARRVYLPIRAIPRVGDCAQEHPARVRSISDGGCLHPGFSGSDRRTGDRTTVAGEQPAGLSHPAMRGLTMAEVGNREIGRVEDEVPTTIGDYEGWWRSASNTRQTRQGRVAHYSPTRYVPMWWGSVGQLVDQYHHDQSCDDPPYGEEHHSPGGSVAGHHGAEDG